MQEFRQIIWLTFFIISTINFSIAQENRHIPLIHSNTETISYQINGVKNGWNIMPNLKPDRLSVACKEETTEVVFITDIDSIKFNIKPNQHYYFNILLNNRDTALTEIVGIKYVKPASFNKKYISEHKGKVFVEVPEVQELTHIIFAITDIGQNNSNMIDMTTSYYKKVIQHFLHFKNHPIVMQFDTLLKQGYYTHLKMNSCAYIFKENGIVKGGIYDRLAWTDENNLEPFIKHLQDFAIKSDFRKFYKGNLPYYNSLIKEQKKKVPVEKMWEWLENEFPDKYDSYKITFSPLVYGSHSTNRFEDNGFSETVMFICGPNRGTFPDNYSDKVWEGFLARVVFTEIDHNYVNPVTDKYAKEVDKTFINKKQWVTEKAVKYYPSTYAIFNEYMTWGVFTLYIYYNFSKEDFEIINKKTEDMMSDGRGFYKYREFNKQLLDLYKARVDGQKVTDLYPKILEWCSNLK